MCQTHTAANFALQICRTRKKYRLFFITWNSILIGVRINCYLKVITLLATNHSLLDFLFTSEKQDNGRFMTKIGHSAIWGFSVKKAAFSCQTSR